MNDLIKKYLIEKGMGKGWNKASIEKLSATIGKSPGDKGFFDACYSHMSKNMDDQTAKGLCANIKDTSLQSTYWRNKPHDKAMKDIKNKKNVK